MFTWIIYIIHKEPPGKHLEKEISSAVQHKEQNDCKEKKITVLPWIQALAGLTA